MTPDILICDDNARIRALLAEIVNEVGYVHECVDSGEAALEACRARPYRLVFLDVVMPGMTGVQTAHAIRALPVPNNGPYLVALTGYPGEVTHEQMVAAGFDRQLTKPESYDVIAGVIRQVMR